MPLLECSSNSRFLNWIKLHSRPLEGLGQKETSLTKSVSSGGLPVPLLPHAGCGAAGELTVREKQLRGFPPREDPAAVILANSAPA